MSDRILHFRGSRAASADADLVKQSSKQTVAAFAIVLRSLRNRSTVSVTSGKNAAGEVRHVAKDEHGQRVGTYDTYLQAQDALVNQARKEN